ncbi:hypothetical protein R80B4_00786 [Fibrobacteres bacterium R8-0-B4]
MADVIDLEVQEALDYLHYSLAKQDSEVGNPNEADELSLDKFAAASEKLIVPFAEVVAENYA